MFIVSFRALKFVKLFPVPVLNKLCYFGAGDALRWFPHNIRAIMAQIKFPEKAGGMLLFWIQLIRTYRDLSSQADPREKIKLEVVHISLKVPISSKLLLSHLILHFMQWTSAKKFFDLDKKRFGYECLKTWKSFFLAVHPYRWSQHRHAQSCHLDSGTCDFRLDLSRLFCLCKFSFEFHVKCSFPACCMNY